MRTRFVDSRVLLFVALLLLGAPAVVWRLAPAQAAGKAACAAVGTYQIGSGIGVMAPPMPGSPQTGPGGSSIAMPYPVTELSGTLTIATYSGCGTPTTGTFKVRRVLAHVPRVQPQQGTSKQTIVGPCIGCLQVAGVSSATGSFTQDTGHANDPRYVSVSGTIVSTRPGIEMGRPCTVQGCPPASVITSTVVFTDVTGYLQVAQGTPGEVTLSVLPPPDDTSMTAPTALILTGSRGRSGVQPLEQGARR
jgi:hypothetical protein